MNSYYRRGSPFLHPMNRICIKVSITMPDGTVVDTEALLDTGAQKTYWNETVIAKKANDPTFRENKVYSKLLNTLVHACDDPYERGIPLPL